MHTQGCKTKYIEFRQTFIISSQTGKEHDATHTPTDILKPSARANGTRDMARFLWFLARTLQHISSICSFVGQDRSAVKLIQVYDCTQTIFQNALATFIECLLFIYSSSQSEEILAKEIVKKCLLQICKHAAGPKHQRYDSQKQ